ncbi:MAG: hypothetical protein PVH88_20950 [Ignavibacteria bacterium]
MKIVLKELRETSICLKIIFKTKLFKSDHLIKKAMSVTSHWS